MTKSNNTNETKANVELDSKIANATKQKVEITENLFRKDYLVTIFQTGDQTMSTGDFERQESPRRYYQHCSLQDLPEVIAHMQTGFWKHPDLKADLSNAKDIPFEEKKWGINYDITIEPIAKELEENYLKKVKSGFFENYRSYFERHNETASIDEDSIKVDQDVPMPEEDMPSGSIN